MGQGGGVKFEALNMLSGSIFTVSKENFSTKFFFLLGTRYCRALLLDVENATSSCPGHLLVSDFCMVLGMNTSSRSLSK